MSQCFVSAADYDKYFRDHRKPESLFTGFVALTKAHFVTGLRTPTSNVIGQIVPVEKIDGNL